MATEESSVNFLLYKPLHLLTEDDIAQVTREDCRRFLKEKGMRRPSWNKSQAIQQVIMLKKLLETTPDCDLGSRKRLRVSLRENDDSVPESVPDARYRRMDLERPDSSTPAANCEPTHPRIKGSPDMSGQMTIFYCGKVNVYDDVQADKARALLQIAAGPLEASQHQTVEGSMILQPLSRLSKTVSTKAHPDSAVIFPNLQTAKMIGNTLKLGEEGNIFREKAPGKHPFI